MTSDACGDLDFCCLALSCEDTRAVVELASEGDLESVRGFHARFIYGARDTLAGCRRLGCRLHNDQALERLLDRIAHGEQEAEQEARAALADGCDYCNGGRCPDCTPGYATGR